MKNKVIIAFPGCGKTTATKALIKQGVKALDFDCKGIRGGNVPLNTRFVNGYYKRGYHVFINDGLVDLHKFPKDTPIIVYLPGTEKEDWIARIKARGDNQEFIDEMNNCFFGWKAAISIGVLSLRIDGFSNIKVVHLGKDEFINVADILTE